MVKIFPHQPPKKEMREGGLIHSFSSF